MYANRALQDFLQTGFFIRTRNPKYAHHDLCEKSIYYGKRDDEKEAMREEKKRRQKEGIDKRTGFAQAEKALTELFGDSDQAKQLLRRAECEKRKDSLRRDNKPKDATDENVELTGVDVKFEDRKPSKKDLFLDNVFSAEYLCQYIDEDNLKHVSRAPNAIESIIRCISGMSPTLKRGCNEIARGIENESRACWFQQIFPPGTITFKVPRQNATAKPHLLYRAAEDVKIVFVRWELQSDAKLLCPLCKNGELIHGRCGIKKNSVQPILDVGGKIIWSMVMHYNCVDCNKQIRGDDQLLLDSLPDWMRESFPCHDKWNTRDTSFRLSRELVRMLEHTSIFPEGSIYITRLLEDQFSEDRNRYMSARKLWMGKIESEAPQTKEFVPPGFMLFQEWLGDVEIPNQEQLTILWDLVKNTSTVKTTVEVLYQSLAIPKKAIKPKSKKDGESDKIATAGENHRESLHLGKSTKQTAPQLHLVPPYPPNRPPSGFMNDGLPHMMSPYPYQGFHGFPQGYPQGFPHDRSSLIGLPPPVSISHMPLSAVPPGMSNCGGIFIPPPFDKMPPWLCERNSGAGVLKGIHQEKKNNSDGDDSEASENPLNENNKAQETLTNNRNTLIAEDDSESKLDIEEKNMKVLRANKGDDGNEKAKYSDPETTLASNDEEIDKNHLLTEGNLDNKLQSGNKSQSPSGEQSQSRYSISAAQSKVLYTDGREERRHRDNDTSGQSQSNGAFTFVPFQGSHPPQSHLWVPHPLQECGPLGSPTKRQAVGPTESREESITSTGGNKKVKKSGHAPQLGPGPQIQHQYHQGQPFMYHPNIGPIGGYPYQSYPPPRLAPYTEAVLPPSQKTKKTKNGKET